METYTISFADGTIIDNLRLNGNNYISSTELTEAVFAGNLRQVTITDSDGNINEYTNMELVQLQRYGNEWWFILRKKSTQQMSDERLRADIDYIAMMTDVELEG